VEGAEELVGDLKRALAWLDAHYIYTPEQLERLRGQLAELQWGRERSTKRSPQAMGVC
jgi:hypothetical protein